MAPSARRGGACWPQGCEAQLPPGPATPATPPLSLCKPPWEQKPDETSPTPQRAEPGAGARGWAPASPGPSPSAGSCLLSGRVHKPFPQITSEQNSFQRLRYLQMRGFRLLSEIQCCFLCKRRAKTVREEETTSNANLVRLNCSLNRWRRKAAGVLSLRGRVRSVGHRGHSGQTGSFALCVDRAARKERGKPAPGCAVRVV